MFENEYKEAFEQLQPSAELQQETLALMKEAQNHCMAPEPPRKTWKPAYTVSLASTAAAIMVCVVGASFFLGQSKNFDESEGEWFLTEEENSFSSNASDKESSDLLVDPMEGQSDSDKKYDEPSSSAPEDDYEEKAKEELADESTENMTDPFAPVIVDTADTATYLSLGAFLKEIDQMNTLGFGTHYVCSKELLLLPSSLPEGSRFRCLYLSAETGEYTYSYLLKEGYFLDIKVRAELPKTAAELSALQQKLPAVYTLQKNKNQRVYTFGDFAEMTVSLLPAGTTDLPDEATADGLLKNFEPAFYNGNNSYLDLTY